MESITGKWRGKFTYDDPKLEFEKRDHPFEMTITVDEDDDVSGEITDESADEKSPGKATLTGFIDEDEISFIKQYPFLFQRNDNNETILDTNKPHPEIHYHGIIKDDQISGTWEMEIGVMMSAGQYHSQMVTGKWETIKAGN